MEGSVHKARLVRFGTFEVDLRSGELRRAGVKLKLSGQPFQVLAILLEQAGEIVPREELQRRLWPNTFVDGDHNLNTAINRIREVLGDSAESPRFVETIPRRGYRFIAPVEGDGVAAPSAPPDKREQSGQRSWAILSVVLVSAVILIAGAGTFLHQRRRVATPAAQRRLTRLTFDEGLQIGATWSPDSRFVAYSSDRGGKFDIWVQQVSGGDPVRITSKSGHNWQPDWSPDGKYIAYRSEEGEGGLFIVPALGGSGMERKIASFGYYPRWSPDSSQILFQTTQFGWLNHLYVVNLEGMPPREVLTQLAASSHATAISAAWHPDGKRVSALINSDPVPTFWTGSVTGGAPVNSDITPEILRQIGEVAADNKRGGRIYEHEWAVDFKFSWEPSGRAIYFERTFRGARNIWRITVDPQTLRTISIERVTTGPGLDTELALSPDGKRLAFTEESAHIRAWTFPFDATHGRVTGEGRPITSPGVDAWLPSLSPDGKRLAFSSVRAGKWELMELSLPDGREAPVGSDDYYHRDYAQWSPDSNRLAYVRRNNTTGESQIAEWTSQSRSEEPLTPPLQGAPKLFDWSRRSDALLISRDNKATGRSEIAVLSMVADAHAEAETAARPIIADAGYDLYQSRLSPDGRWIVFEALPVRNDQPPSVSAIFVSPAAGQPWVRVTDGTHWDDKPRWSPDGKMIYFVSGRSGFFNVWGMRFDPANGKTVGDPFAVTAFDSPSEMIPNFIPTVALSVTQDRLVLTVAQASGSIWVLDNIER